MFLICSQIETPPKPECRIFARCSWSRRALFSETNRGSSLWIAPAFPTITALKFFAA